MKITVFGLLISVHLLACVKQVITISSDALYLNEDSFEITIHAYKSKNPTEKQNIILPPIGGTTVLEDKYARKICARGMSSYVLVNWTGDYEESISDLTVHNRAVEKALHAIEVFLEKNPYPTTLLGTSLGGIYVGVAVGKFDLIKKAAIITSGTNLAGILAYGMLPETIEQRKTRMDYFGFTQDEYYEALDEVITLRAENYSENLRDKKLLHLRTRNDEVIDIDYQNQLIDLFTRSNVYIYDLRFRHRNSIIWAYARRSNRIANFLSNI